MQNGSLISKYYDLFVVHFLVNHCKQLGLETCWLIMRGTYQIMENWIIYCIKLPVIKLNNQIPMRIRKKMPNSCSWLAS